MEKTDIHKKFYAEVCFCGELALVEIIIPRMYENVEPGNSRIEQLVFGFSYADGMLRYEGDEALTFSGSILSDVCHEGNGERELKMIIVHNGVQKPVEEGKVNCSGSTYKKLHAFFEIFLIPGDTIRLMAANMNGTEAIKVKNFKLSIMAKE